MAGIFSFCFPNTFLSAAATAETAGRERENDTPGKLFYSKAAQLQQRSPKSAYNLKSTIKPIKKKKVFKRERRKEKKKKKPRHFQSTISPSFVPAFHLFPLIIFSILYHCPLSYFCYITCFFFSLSDSCNFLAWKRETFTPLSCHCISKVRQPLEEKKKKKKKGTCCCICFPFRTHQRVSEQDFQLKMSFFSLSQEADVAQCVND